MVRISRYILVLAAVIGLAVAMPNLYWTIMEKPVNSPFVMYSCVDNTFMIQHTTPTLVREDLKGNKYTREEYEQKLPLMYNVQLSSNGTMPDSINGVAMDMRVLRKARSNYKYQPKSMDSPQPGIYPLFESQSGRVNLEMPNDFFRIRNRIEFIEATSNKVDEEKSSIFTAALTKRGFTFPALLIAGLPTTRKSCDEGYLVTDANNQLFHLKMEKGKPYVKNVKLPENLSFKWIECVDFANKLYYAYLISATNEIYVLFQDTYELLKLPVSGFNPEVDVLKILGDLFHYNVIIEGDSYLKAVVLDSKFSKVDEYSEKWEDKYHRKEGKIFDFIFPFELTLKSETSRFIDFRLNHSSGYYWLLLSMLLVGLEVYWIRRMKNKITDHLLDLGIIVVTGIFGFIAVNIFQNKFFK
jgi:hypothetical protein